MKTNKLNCGAIPFFKGNLIKIFHRYTYRKKARKRQRGRKGDR